MFLTAMLTALLWIAAQAMVLAMADPAIPPVAPEVVPSLPVEWQTGGVSCDLDFLNIGFGGLRRACSRKNELDRAKCCPVLASWLLVARVNNAIFQASSPSPSPAPSPYPEAQAAESFEMPVPPDDSAVCSTNLNEALESRGEQLNAPNATCDLVMCFCGIKLRQLGVLNGCPGIFSMSKRFLSGNESAVPLLQSLQANCTDPSFLGCSSCLSSLDSIARLSQKKTLHRKQESGDCRLAGLMWLLASNRTLYLPVVTSLVRALIYSDEAPAYPQCSADDKMMPLAFESVGPDPSNSSSSTAENLVLILLLALCSTLHLLLLQIPLFRL